ncbi:hypothetical protein FRB90_011277 [Tulasnella sp. 427]|nr:hypothetical protein FRB90_011277 [Tulasnella sp. 427]
MQEAQPVPAQEQNAGEETPKASLPLYLQRLLEQLDKAHEQRGRPEEERQTAPISFDLLRAANRIQPSEFRLRLDGLGKEKTAIFEEESAKAKKNAWSDDQGDNPYANIRAYVRNARLPPLPWCIEAPKANMAKEAESVTNNHTAGGSSRTYATTGTFAQPRKGGQTTERNPDCVRELRRIKKIPNELFKKKVQDFSTTLPVGFQPALDEIESRQPGLWDGDKGHDDEYLSLKSSGFKVRDHSMKVPETEKQVADWIEQFPAMTAARVLHVCDSGTLEWSYQPKLPPGNFAGKEETIRRLLVEVKAPWAMDLESLDAFVNTPKIPTVDEIRNTQVVDSSNGLVDFVTVHGTGGEETQTIEQVVIPFSKGEDEVPAQ